MRVASGFTLPSRSDRNVVVAGAATTMALIAIFLFVPYLIPLERLQHLYFEVTGDVMMGNPFSVFRYLGGIVGGFLTAYVTAGQWHDRVVNGLKAVTYGVVGLYVLVVVSYSAVAIAVWETFPILQIVVNPFIVGLPVGVISLFGAFFGVAVACIVRI